MLLRINPATLRGIHHQVHVLQAAIYTASCGGDLKGWTHLLRTDYLMDEAPGRLGFRMFLSVDNGKVGFHSRLTDYDDKTFRKAPIGQAFELACGCAGRLEVAGIPDRVWDAVYLSTHTIDER